MLTDAATAAESVVLPMRSELTHPTAVRPPFGAPIGGGCGSSVSSATEEAALIEQ